MMRFLVRKFIPDSQNTSDPKVRTAYGILSGVVGILLNLILFLSKLIMGLLAHSISITADAFNNLSDAGSSVLTMFGFRLAAQKPDAAHPFGHGRAEYITGLLVSVLIIVVGFSLGRDSLDRVLHPETTVITALSTVILLASILVKLYMFCYNRRFSRLISSVALDSTARDSLNDVISTGAVLAAQLLSLRLHVQLDGWCGLGIAVFILWGGLSSMKETIDPLLGQEPDPALVQQIETVVNSYDHVLGMHDLIIHDYGPDRRMMSFHLEVPSDMTLTSAHELADRIELRLSGEFGISTVIHVDPVDQKDPLTQQAEKELKALLQYLGPDLRYHDLRVIREKGHLRIFFDVELPYDMQMSDQEVVDYLKREFHGLNPGCRLIIHVDHFQKSSGNPEQD